MDQEKSCWLSADLSEVLLSLQQLLLAGSRVGEQLVPALEEGGVPGLDGPGLDVLGGQQLLLQSRDVADALLLEGLQTCIKGLLHTHTHTQNSQENTQSGLDNRRRIKGRSSRGEEQEQHLLGEQGLHGGQVPAVVVRLQAVLLLT